jgi:NAD(P)-dependent dehydrogenase (short-subunit alcohol dehydrogenase family)
VTPAFDLEGRVAMVTGAGRGIGREVADVLAAAGARVVVTDRDVASGLAAERALRENGADARFYELDVREHELVREVADEVAGDYGRIDILVNNAGIVFNSSAEDMSADEWRDVLDVNLSGVFWCCQAVGRHMIRRSSGAIVSIASMAGIVALDPQPQAHYNVSKAGVIMLTRSIAVEWARHNVRVNAVSPGYIGTELTKMGLSKPDWAALWHARTPLGRVGDARDVANAVLYLASDAASFVTGENLVVDGGYTIW